MKISVFCYVTPCSSEENYQCFGGLYCFHLQDPPKISYLSSRLPDITFLKTVNIYSYR
jgi:hypothetical protein